MYNVFHPHAILLPETYKHVAYKNRPICTPRKLANIMWRLCLQPEQPGRGSVEPGPKVP